MLCEGNARAHGRIRMWAWMLSARSTDIIRMWAGCGDGMQSSMDVMLWERVAVEHGHKSMMDMDALGIGCSRT